MTDHTASNEVAILIEALERADGPSRELDARLYMAFHPDCQLMTDTGGYRNERPVAYTLAAELWPVWRGTGSDFADLLSAPAYTTSIDAALTLVPEGWAWTTARYWCEGEDAPPFYADCADLPALVSGQDAPVYEGKAATPAIALVIAALRAKGAQS